MYAFSGKYFSKDYIKYHHLVTPGNFSPSGGLQFDEGKTTFFTSDYPADFELRIGDQLIVLTDLSYKKLILGRCVTVDRNQLLLNQRVAKLIFPKSTAKLVDPSYLNYFLNAPCWREQLVSTAVGSTVFHSSPAKVGDCRLPLPPVPEQVEISRYITAETEKLDRTRKTVMMAIEHLGEYRSALITAAVTGKIDIRDQVKAAA